MMNFKGAAKRLDDIDLPKLGAQIGVGEVISGTEINITVSGFIRGAL